MSDLMRAVEEIREHAEAYQLAADYYQGKVGELFTSPAVKRALRSQVCGFDVNLARRPVDAVLDRVKITALSVTDQPEATRRLVDEVWNPNRMSRYAKTVHWASLTYGDAYLVVWPGADDNSVELFYNSPVTTRMFYRAENPREKDFAAKMWTEGSGSQERVRVNLYYADRIEKWISKTDRADQDSDFVAYEIDGEPWPLANPYGVVPVFHFRTDEPYGHPEHAGAFGPQNAITKLSATLMATIDFQGFPQRYALMEASADDLVDWDEDDSLADPSNRDSSLRANPGELWRLPGTTKVGQFDPANVEAFLKPIGAYTRLMASSTATPLRFFDPQGQVPSGEALRADEAPLAARIHDAESWWADSWVESLVFASSVIGLPIDDLASKWAPVHTVQDEQGWKTVLLKIQAGVPFEQVMTEVGYQSELVETWVRDQEVERGRREAAPTSGSGA